MDSIIFLRIKDEQIRTAYTLQRSKDIIMIGLITAITRICTLMFSVLSWITQLQQFTTTYWMVRCFGILWHIMVLILAYYFPLKCSRYCAALIMPTLIISLIYLEENPNFQNLMAINLTCYSILMLIGILLNESWVVTSLAMIASCVGGLSFYVVYLGMYDLTFYAIITQCLGLSIFACYFYEKRLKLQFIQVEQIKLMNEELKQILEILPEGILLYNDADKKVTLVNAEFKRLFGNCKGDEFANNKVHSLNLKEYNPKQQANTQPNSNPISQVNILQASLASPENEEEKCFEIIRQQTENSHSNDDANLHGDVVSFRQCKILYQNITQTMILMKNLTNVAKCEQLQIENYFYEMLTAAVSHDMRTPLNSIIGLLSNLDMFITDSTGKKFLGIILNSSKFMLFLVNDLLDFFQIKNGKFRRNERTTNLNNSIIELLEMFNLGAKEKGIQINYIIDQRFPTQLLVDEQRVKQVMLNLLQNALKFTMKGSITVKVFYSARNEQIRVSVADTGIGIPQASAHSLFKMFGKLEDSAQINPSGIGLGLNICKQIVEAFDGAIYLEDSSEAGTTFTFTIKCVEILDFPTQVQNRKYSDLLHIEETQFEDDEQEILIIPESQNQSEIYASNIKFTDESQYQVLDSGDSHRIMDHFIEPIIDLKILNNFKRMKDENHQSCFCSPLNRVLIADDNVFNIVTLQSILELKMNMKSDKAMNGKDAVDLVIKRLLEISENPCKCARNRHYSIIFMDVNMPIMDGLQASQEIRRIEQINKVDQPVFIVALTAYSGDTFKKKFIDSGMNEFLTKPINTIQLSQIIKDKLQ